LAPRKRWGQNFLISPEIRLRLIKALEAPQNSLVWEIGPGLGAMTKLLIEAGYRLVVFEIDPAYCQILNETFSRAHFRLVEGDVLKKWSEEAQRGVGYILGNLPYNLAGTLLGVWAEQGLPFIHGVFLIQKELADRMSAQPRTKNYSSFSVLSQSIYQIETLFSLSPQHFFPKPEVMSTAVRLKPYRPQLSEPIKYAQFLKLCFTSRRKTLKNNLEQAARFGFNPEGIKEHFSEHQIPLSLRAEELEVSTYLELWNHPARRARFT